MTSGTFRHSFPHIRREGERDNVLIDLARGKRVLHVGCTDEPFTAEKIASGDLLHPKLQQVASWVGGVDTVSYTHLTLPTILRV